MTTIVTYTGPTQDYKVGPYRFKPNRPQSVEDPAYVQRFRTTANFSVSDGFEVSSSSDDIDELGSEELDNLELEEELLDEEDDFIDELSDEIIEDFGDDFVDALDIELEIPLPPGPPNVTDSAGKLLRKHKINAMKVKGSGIGGRIIKKDVEAYLVTNA